MPNNTIVSWSNTQIVVQIPDSVTLFPNGPDYGYVMVRSGGSNSNTDINFQLESKLTDIAYEQVGTNIRVTLTGTSLGKDPGGFQRSTYFDHVRLGESWIANASVISWNNNTIVFEVPNSTPAGVVSVTSNGYESNTLLYSPFNRIFLPLTQH
jgi:hypothetical protein